MNGHEPIRRPMISMRVDDPTTLVPLRTVSAKCFFCQRITEYPAPDVVDAEVDMWRSKYERILGLLNTAIQECNRIFGDDPMRQHFEREMLRIRRSLDERRGRDRDGDAP